MKIHADPDAALLAAMRQARERGWHTVRDCTTWTAISIWVLGYAKIQRVDHLPGVWQMRLTGSGRMFLTTHGNGVSDDSV